MEEELSEFALDEEVEIIVDASVRLRCSFLTRCKALLIYHHFKRCVPETKYDPYLVAAACISLSMKYNEEVVEFDAVILVFFCLIDQGAGRSTQDKKIKAVKKSVMTMEFVILRMLEFALNHALAHEYLAYFLNDVHEELSNLNVWDVITETCMKLSSDVYLTSRCLNYKAEEIATTVIQTALYMAGIDISEDHCHLNAWSKTINDCSESKRQDIIEDIFRISDIGPVAERKRNASA